MDRVVYKPLDTSPQMEVDEYQHDEEEEEGEEEIEFDREALVRRPPYCNQSKQHAMIFNSAGRFSLRQLRLLLYLVALILFLLFIAQLTTNTSQKTSSPSPTNNFHRRSDRTSELVSSNPVTSYNSPQNIQYSTISPNISSNDLYPKLKHQSISQLHDKRPQYESYLSSELDERNSRGQQTNSAELYDDLHFPLEGQQHEPPPISTIWWTLNMRDGIKYVTVTNYIRAMKSFSHNASITLTTQATTEFMYHTLELCKRWDGPISVAIFSPGPEMLIATTLIKYMRQCLPGPLSACIRDKVTWHLVYNKRDGPSPSLISYPKYLLDSKNYPLFVAQDQCPKLAGPEPADLIKQFELELRKVNLPTGMKTYREEFHLPYPINVLRNTARLAATTKYVLASDIELYPSANLVPSFANLLKNHNLRLEYDNIEKFIFTLPIFEVKANVSAPKTKDDLIRLVRQGDAIFFHKWVCDYCQNFPNRLDWLQTDKYGLTDYQAESDELSIFEITQRDKLREFWEPIFIGTNDDPLYDDRLTWEGRRDKMIQMYEMCLQDYHLLVLGNAFLVHAPGIKHIDKQDNMRRINYMRENNAIHDASMLKLKQKYAGTRNIDKC